MVRQVWVQEQLQEVRAEGCQGWDRVCVSGRIFWMKAAFLSQSWLHLFNCCVGFAIMDLVALGAWAAVWKAQSLGRDSLVSKCLERGVCAPRRCTGIWVTQGFGLCRVSHWCQWDGDPTLLTPLTRAPPALLHSSQKCVLLPACSGGPCWLCPFAERRRKGFHNS